jgi:hypothetical protein
MIYFYLLFCLITCISTIVFLIPLAIHFNCYSFQLILDVQANSDDFDGADGARVFYFPSSFSQNVIL